MTFFIPDIKANRGKFSDVTKTSFFLKKRQKERKREETGSHFG